MTTEHDTSPANMCLLEDDAIWANLYHLLRPLVKHWVYSAHVPSWKGQEDDIVDDIVQEAITRTFRHSQRAEYGEVSEIGSLKGLSVITARHHYYDLRVRESRLVLFTQLEYSSDGQFSTYTLVRDDEVDPAEIAVDNAFQGVVFLKLASIVVNFPDKQRCALLIDLANHMDFDTEPTPLQQAFLEVGIHLQDYRQPATRNAAEQNRHLSSLSTAYKRLSMIPVK